MGSMDNIDAAARAVIRDGVIACLRLEAGAPLVEAAEAVMRGGLQIIEVTLTTPDATQAIRKLRDGGADWVGAGTVLSDQDVKRVAKAGARFVLSPVFDPAVVETAHALGLLAVPGAATPAEILRAHRSGARLVKVFPSGALGGPEFLTAVRGPLPDIALVPTSGPTAENLADYLAAGAAAVGVGAELFPPGFTVDDVEAASRRVRDAIAAYRTGTGFDPA